MGTQTISKLLKHGVHLTGSNNTVIVTQKGSIVAGIDFNAISTDGGDHNHLIINGSLSATFDNLSFGIDLDSDNSSIEIGATGGIKANSSGINVSASHVTIDNAGTINTLGSGNTAVSIHGPGGPSAGTTLHNSGTISGDTGVTISANGSLVNEAGGKIIADTLGIGVGEGFLNLINHGTIKSQQVAIHDDTTTVKQHIVNDGRIIGSLVLLGGDDVVDTRGGVIYGEVFGGLGDDVLITDNSGILLKEYAGNGDDWVKSTVSYNLPDNVEGLILLGKKNINAFGNNDAGTDNYLYGNAGNNLMQGFRGYNELFGGGGTDTLVGGHGVDLFGIGQGYGHDTVKGFVDGRDGIDIYLLGPNDFAQLKSHIEQHGADTWLDFGKDVLILRNVDHTVLDAGDFLFNY
jgi:hypothetical protein